MPGNYSKVKTVITGEIITALDRNAEHDNHITFSTPASHDDYSQDLTEMRSTVDPYPAGVESLPTTLAGELERMRYLLKQITGQAEWYIDPTGALTNVAFVNVANIFTTSQQVLASLSGGNLFFSVTNSSDTANSQAKFHVQVGGALAADPFINFRITGLSDWAIGIDNSDSDNFKISNGALLGANDRIVITTTGLVGINGSPDAYGALDVQSTVGALLPPRMTTAQRDALTPANSMVIYNTTTNKFQGYQNGAWTDFVGAAADHGALTGLTPDDDHPHYALLAGRTGAGLQSSLILGSTVVDSISSLVLRNDAVNWNLYCLGNIADRFAIGTDTVTALQIATNGNIGFNYKVAVGGLDLINDDFTVGKNTAAADVRGSVYQFHATGGEASQLITNSNPSKPAYLYLNVSSDGVGDPFVVCTVGGGSSWSFGLDNSAADSFKISGATTLGTNDYVIIDTSGNVGIGGAAAAGVLDVNRTITGGTVRLAVWNKAVSGTSGAQIDVRIETGSTGDPSIIFHYTGGAGWGVGMDTSDSDNFKISKGAGVGVNSFVIRYSDGLTINQTVPAAHAFSTVNQTISDNTWTAIAFNSDYWDTDNMHSTTLNTSRMTTITPGKYRYTAHASFVSNVTGIRGMRFKRNGTSQGVTLVQTSSVLTLNPVLLVCVYEFNLLLSDYVEVEVYQNTGGNLDIFDHWFTIEKISD